MSRKGKILADRVKWFLQGNFLISGILIAAILSLAIISTIDIFWQRVAVCTLFAQCRASSSSYDIS